MKRRDLTNLPASVHQRLLNLSRQTRRPFNELLQYYQSVWIEYPELLDFGRPRLLGYTPESAIAEKFQAMVELEMANTRLKYFFDIWRLSQNLRFDGMILCQAIAATFKQRGTPLPTSPPLALTPTFSADPIKEAQWRAFLRKALLVADTKTLAKTVEDLIAFILLPTFAAVEGKDFKMTWRPGGPWGAG